MMALLSGAWWAQKLAGVTAQALAVAVMAAVVIGCLVGGLWWLRHDARRDERVAGQVATANARVQAMAAAAVRQRKSEAIAAQRAGDLAMALELERAALEHVEAELTALQDDPIVYPKALARALNR